MMKIPRLTFLWIVLFSALVGSIPALLITFAYGHDRNHPVDAKTHDWFMGLKSGLGPCCADADGNMVQDADWESRDGHYRVRLDNKWIDVPDEAVVKEPNLYGPTMVWPMYNWENSEFAPSIRCFMPGSMG